KAPSSQAFHTRTRALKMNSLCWHEAPGRARPGQLWDVGIELKHEEVVFTIGFHKVILIGEAIACLGGFLLDHVLLDAVIFPISITADDADTRSAQQRIS